MNEHLPINFFVRNFAFCGRLTLFSENTRNRHDRAPTMWWFDAISKVFYKTDWNKYSELQICWIFRALKQLRAIDDKIIYALNVSTPTASMQVVHANFFSFTVFLTKEEFGQNKCFFSFLSDPGVPGVLSMGPDVRQWHYVLTWLMWLWLKRIATQYQLTMSIG